MAEATTPAPADAKVVEGSDGLLLEVDGQVIPNYDATISPFEEGEEVDALVLTKEDQDGRLMLSKKRARFEKAWRRIEAAAESGEPVEGTVIEVVKGGLIID